MPVVTPRFDLDPDTTLGGANASDEVGATQKAVKDYVDNKPGLTVDQTYDGTSANAQSGTAVAEAISTKANDSDVVKTSGNQTVGGIKTMTSAPLIDTNDSDGRILTKLENITIGTNPTKNSFAGFTTQDSQGTNFASVNSSYNTAGRIASNFWVHRSDSGSNVDSTLGIYIDKNGTSAYTQAPTPTEDTTSSIQIDTVGARNTKLAGYVDTSTNQTIAGNKTFSNSPVISGASRNLIIKNTKITRNTAPSSAVNVICVNGKDSADKNTWGIYHSWNTNKSAFTRLLCYNGTTTDNTYASIGVGYDASGNSYTYAPASDIVDSIVTTTGISKASDGYVKLGNGIIIQWGEVSTWDSNVATATFPIAFSSRPYGYTLTRRTNANTTNDGGNYYTRNVGTTSMSIYRTSSNTGTLSWIAIGY